MKPHQRGEVWLVDLDYEGKTRPCLIFNIPVLDQDRALMTIIPHTTQVRGSRFEVSVQARFLKPGAFDAQGIRSVSYVRLEKKLGSLSSGQIQNVEAAVRLWLGL